MNNLLKQLCEMYVDRQVGIGGTCKDCIRKSLDSGINHIGPVPVYHVGNEYKKDPLKLLFIGSVAYGWDEIIGDRILANARQTEDIVKNVTNRFHEIIFSESYRYTNLIKYLLKSIFGSLERGFSRVAITNVIHCNSGNVRGGATAHMKYHCAHSDNEFMLTKREIEVLQPRNIISLAGSSSNGRDYIESHWDLSLEKISFQPHPAGSKGGSFENYAERIQTFLGQHG